MRVRGTTRVLGIFGDPVAHSLSPVMHNAALQLCGIDAVYVPFHVAPNDLAAAVAGMRALQLWGLSITVPHKETILPLLDEVDAFALQIGAVNTVVNRSGRLIGYNTDAPGLVRALREELDFEPRGQRVLLLGAGGACRAALVALASTGATWIGVANRSRARAAALLDQYRGAFPECEMIDLELSATALAELLPTVDLVVNTSAIGLKGERFDLPLIERVSSQTRIFDMVYSATATTPLVADARAAGLRATDGRSMLVAQGEEAFALWTATSPPAGVMQRALSLKDIDM